MEEELLEFAIGHSIIWSARSSSDGGIVRPNGFAVIGFDKSISIRVSTAGHAATAYEEGR